VVQQPKAGLDCLIVEVAMPAIKRSQNYTLYYSHRDRPVCLHSLDRDSYTFLPLYLVIKVLYLKTLCTANVIECVQKRGDCGDEKKWGNRYVSSLIKMFVCVRSGFARLLEIRVYVVGQLVCVLLCAVACKDNFAC